MTREQLQAFFPNATQDFLRANSDVKCNECGREFIPIVRNGKGLFCCQKCAAINIGRKTIQANQRRIPVTKILNHNCHACGKEFSAWKSANRKYCSSKCSGKIASVQSGETKSKSGWYQSHNPYSRCASGWRVVGERRVFFRSSWEANYGRFLEWQKSLGLIKDWEHEPETFWFRDIQRGCRSYLPDFRVTHNKGNIEYHEVKGWMNSKSKTKIKRMKKYFPEVVLRVVGEEWFKENSSKLKTLIHGWEAKKR